MEDVALKASARSTVRKRVGSLLPLICRRGLQALSGALLYRTGEPSSRVQGRVDQKGGKAVADGDGDGDGVRAGGVGLCLLLRRAAVCRWWW